jgi:hypothetical protein
MINFRGAKIHFFELKKTIASNEKKCIFAADLKMDKKIN